MGFLVLLERLTPIERAVFVLHDVLDHPYDVVAEAVGRSPRRRAARRCTAPASTSPCRRAGRRPSAARPRRSPTRFLAVGLGGDVDALLAALAPDVVVPSDGGGVAHAAMRTGRGPRRVGPLPRQPRPAASATTRSSCRAS